MSHKANKKCVLIDARFIPGSSGGVETVAMGLASGLSEINFDDIEIKFLVLKQHCEWIKNFIDSDLIFVQDSRNWFLKEVRDKMKFHRYRWSKKHFSQLPVCDKRIEELSPDLVHFVFQCGYKTASDFLYQPHDLQHLHYSEFFPPKVIRNRETKYRYLSNHSKYIVVGTQWIKNDVLDKYGVEDSKVKVVPLAPYSYPYDSEQADNAERHKIRFDKFIFYPAAPWPHKNHSLIFRSLCQLRDRGLIIPIVLSGPRSTGLDLSLLVQEFGIEDQVQDIGFVTDTELQHVYKSATALVMPSLFEAESLPVWEAFEARTPVVCSNVTSMPDQIGDAGLLFNPLDASDLAEKLENIWNDDRLRDELASRGSLRVSRISWRETANRYLTLYRTSMLLPVSINELKTLNMSSEIG